MVGSYTNMSESPPPQTSKNATAGGTQLPVPKAFRNRVRKTTAPDVIVVDMAKCA